MKKLLPLLLTALLCLCALCAVSAADVRVGDVYDSQILATVDGHPIPSYNIGGRTCVIIEDLAYYGFRVTWDGENGVVSADSAPLPTHYEKYAGTVRGKGGKIIAGVYETTIVARVNGLEVPSYNIGGYTCVCIEDLGDLADSPAAGYGFSKYYMNAQWDPENGVINLGTFRVTPESENPILEAGLDYGCVYMSGAPYGTVSFGSAKYYRDFRGAVHGVIPLYFALSNGSATDVLLGYASPLGVSFDLDALNGLLAGSKYAENDPGAILAGLQDEEYFETLLVLDSGDEMVLYGAYVYTPKDRIYSLRVITAGGEVIELLDDLWEIDAYAFDFPCDSVSLNRTKTSLLFSLTYKGRTYHYEYDFLTGELDRND